MKELISELLKHPASLQRIDKKIIMELVNKYPFVAQYRMWLAKKLKEESPEKFQAALHTAAAYSPSREKLFHFIHAPLPQDYHSPLPPSNVEEVPLVIENNNFQDQPKVDTRIFDEEDAEIVGDEANNEEPYNEAIEEEINQAEHSVEDNNDINESNEEEVASDEEVALNDNLDFVADKKIDEVLEIENTEDVIVTDETAKNIAPINFIEEDASKEITEEQPKFLKAEKLLEEDYSIEEFEEEELEETIEPKTTPEVDDYDEEDYPEEEEEESGLDDFKLTKVSLTIKEAAAKAANLNKEEDTKSTDEKNKAEDDLPALTTYSAWLKSLRTNYLKKMQIEGLPTENSMMEELGEQQAAKSIEEDQNLVSESLALLLAQQGKKEKAIAMYKALILKYPERADYFVPKIEYLTDK